MLTFVADQLFEELREPERATLARERRVGLEFDPPTTLGGVNEGEKPKLAEPLE